MFSPRSPCRGVLARLASNLPDSSRLAQLKGYLLYGILHLPFVTYMSEYVGAHV